MPLSEADALAIRNTFDILPDDAKPLASDWLKRYKDQQDEFGLPLFPSDIAKADEDQRRFFGMFDDLKSVDAGNGIYDLAERLEAGSGDKLRQREAGMRFLARQLPGVSPDVVRRDFPLYRDDFAMKAGGKREMGDSEFYSFAKEQVMKQRQAQDIRTRSLDAGFRSAIENAGSLEAFSKVAATAGGADKTEVDPSAFLESYSVATTTLNKHRGLVREIMDGVKSSMDGGEVDLEPLKERFLDMPGTERRMVLASLRMQAEKAGKGVKEEKGSGNWRGLWQAIQGTFAPGITGEGNKYLQQVGESAGRLIGSASIDAANAERIIESIPEAGEIMAKGDIKTPEDARRYVRDAVARETSFQLSATMAGPGGVGAAPVEDRQSFKLGSEAKGWIQDAKEREKKRLRLNNEIRTIGEAADPIPNVFASTIGTSGAALLLMAGTRGLAAPALAQAYSNIEYNDLSLKYPTMSRTDKAQIAGFSGAAKAALDYVGVKALDKLPGIKSLILQPLTRQLVGRALTRGTYSFVEQNLVEGAQDIATPVLMAALKSDVSGFEWDSEMKNFWMGRADVAVGLLPLTLLGVGAASVNEYRGAKELLTWNDKMAATGIQEQDRLNVIEEAQSGSLAKAQSLFMAAFKRRDPAIAAEYQEKLSDNEKDLAAAREELTRLGMIPDIYRERDGYTVRNGETSAFFKTWDEARAVATESMNDTERAQVELVATMADSFMASTPGYLAGETINIRQRGESLVDRVSAGEMTPENAMEAAVAGGVLRGVTIPEARAIAAEVFGGETKNERALKFREEVEKIVVLGRNVVENGVSKSTANLRNNERAFLTVVEEVVEGRWKGGLQRGKFTKEQGVNWVKLAEAATGETFLQGATWDDIAASSEGAPRALTEAISRIITADVFGRMMDGKRIGPGSVSRGLNLNDREQSALASILKAFQQLFKALLHAANKLAQAQSEGKLGEEYDTLFNELTGGSSQLEHDAGALQEAASIIDTSGYSEATPGPNGETFSIRQLAEDFQQKGKFYRVIQGEDAFRDVVESGLVRTNAAAKVVPGATLLERLKERPTAFPSFSKDYAAMSYAQSNPDHYIIVTDDASLQPSTSGRHSKGKTHFPTNAQGEHLSSLPADKVDVFRHIGDGMYELAYSRGNLISEENTGKPVETFSLRSVSPSQDAEYMAAVEAGDMEKAQRMVDEAAKAAGGRVVDYDRSIPSGKINPRNEPDRKFGKQQIAAVAERMREANDWIGRPILVVEYGDIYQGITGSHRTYAAQDADVSVQAVVVPDEFMVWMDDRDLNDSNLIGTDGWINAREEDQYDALRKAKASGVEGLDSAIDLLFIENESNWIDRGARSLLSNNPVIVGNKVKSADPVTRDESGAVIPLSQRFNPADDRITYSLRSGDFEARAAAMFSPFQRTPELRMAIARVAKERAMRLGAEWIEKAAVLRTSASISKEQAFREADGFDRRVNDYLDSLTPSARQELEFEPASLENDPLVAAMLDEGKLMSRSTAIKNGVQNLDEYDGAPWLPPAWYSKGAGITPGKMAKALHDGPLDQGGPLSGDSAQDLWGELGQIIAATRKNKAAHREAVQAYQDAKKQAKADAKAEAETWAAQAKKQAGSPKAQRESLAAATRTIEGILAAAPPEVRTRAGGYIGSRMAKLATDEARLKLIEETISKLNVELEKWLKKELLQRIAKLFKKFAPKKDDKGRIKSNITAEAAEDIGFAFEFASLDDANQEKEMAAVEKTLEESEDAAEIQDAIGKMAIVQLFHKLENRESSELAAAATWLDELGSGAREARKIIDAARAEQVKEAKDIAKADASNGKLSSLPDAENVEADVRSSTFKRFTNDVKGFLNSALFTMGHQLEIVFGQDSRITTEFHRRAVRAANDSTDIKRDIEARRAAFVANLFGTTSRIKQAGRMGVLTVPTASGVIIETGAKTKTIDVPADVVVRIIEGTADLKALGFTSEEAATLADAWADNEALPVKRQKRVFQIERRSDGKDVELTMSQDEAIQYLLWSSQKASREQMERDGWSKESFQQLNAFLSDDAKALAKFFAEEYARMGRLIEPVYRRMFHAPFPQVDNYSPIFRDISKADSIIDIDQQGHGSGVSSSFILARNKNARSALRRTSAISAFMQHAESASHWISHVELVRDLRSVLIDKEVQNAIRSSGRTAAANGIKKRVMQLENQGKVGAAGIAELDSWGSKLLQARAFKGLAWRISPVIKQASTYLNPLLADVPAWDYMRGTARLLFGELNFSAMWQRPEIQRRIESGFSAEARIAMDRLGYTGSTLLAAMGKGMLPMQLVDAGWTTAGAAVAFDYYRRNNIKSGMNETLAENAALDQLEMMIAESAQPADPANRSLIEGLQNPWLKSMWMFASESRKTLAVEIMALSRLATGKSKNKAMDVQRAVVAHVVMATTTQLMSGILSLLLGDKDDREREWSVEEWAAAIAAGPINGLFLFGDALNYIGRRLFGLHAFEPSTAIGQAVKTVSSAPSNIDKVINGEPEEQRKAFLKLGESVGQAASIVGPGNPFTAADVILGNPLKDADKILARLTD